MNRGIIYLSKLKYLKTLDLSYNYYCSNILIKVLKNTSNLIFNDNLIVKKIKNPDSDEYNDNHHYPYQDPNFKKCINNIIDGVNVICKDQNISWSY